LSIMGTAQHQQEKHWSSQGTMYSQHSKLCCKCQFKGGLTEIWKEIF
jgi:hypothetical protein